MNPKSLRKETLFFAAAYAMGAYQTAYLKANYPDAFLSAMSHSSGAIVEQRRQLQGPQDGED